MLVRPDRECEGTLLYIMIKGLGVTYTIFMCVKQIVRALEGDVSLDDLNEGVKPGQSTVFSSSDGSTDYDVNSYNADMKKFRRMALDYESSNEYGFNSDYGHNGGSSSASAESTEMARQRAAAAGRRQGGFEI